MRTERVAGDSRGVVPFRECSDKCYPDERRADGSPKRTQLRTKGPQHQRTHQRQEPQKNEHRIRAVDTEHVTHPLSTAISSTSTNFVLPKVTTTIARPIAASAAATVMTRKAKMCPSLLAQVLAKVTSAKLAALNISSI